ncbi:unnamed protein product [Cyprideis torosa]|uniref:Replicative DNA helicase n=1 Tax=Cyprideis torosa TaxID=163714 RepID=A0A7R8ZI63_9CRUS|nr:unnamed protein product [Cyprideis torosa]CAG0884105.1 unnamed protein product [Cyprideis torosa]
MAETYESLKTPPHSIDAEQSVLGGLMLDAEQWPVVAALVQEADFYRQDHRLIFRSIAALRDDPARPGIDILTLSDWLKSRNSLDDAGGLAYLGTIAKDVPSAANIRAYAEIVREKSLKRQLIAVASAAVDAGYGDDAVPTAKQLEKLDAQLMRLAEAVRRKSMLVKRIGPAVKEELTALERRSKDYIENGVALMGESTSFAELDGMLSGLRDGEMTVLAARPSMGKSALEGDLALAVARDCQKAGSGGVLEINFEMPVAMMTQRHISRQSGVELSRIMKSWNLTDDDWPKLASGVTPFNRMPLYMLFGPEQGISTVAEVRAIALAQHKQLLKETGRGLRLLTVDYLQLMVQDSSNATAEVEAISRSLKKLAGELSCPVVVLSQLNRSLESRPNKRPVMADLRQSGAIEQDADTIVFIYRDVVYNPETAEPSRAEIIVAKQRNGPIGTVSLEFDAARTRFLDFVPDVYGADYLGGGE